jgi:hypothetical protein
MNITAKRWEKCLELRVQTDWINLLDLIKNEDKGLNSLKQKQQMIGLVSLLVAKNYIDKFSGTLTESGEKLWNLVDMAETKETPKEDEQKIAFEQWVAELWEKLKNTLLELHGQDNAKGFGGKIWFLPSVEDLREVLVRYRKKYKNKWEEEKIEQLLIRHTENCCISKNFSPVLQYYIIKAGSPSYLAAAYDSSGEEVEVSVGSSQKFI